MDKGLKAILHHLIKGVPSAPQPPPRLDSILILPPPTLKRNPLQGDDLELARSPEGTMYHREGLFEEEVRIAMSRLEI